MDLIEKVRSLLTAVFPPPARIELIDEDGIIGTITSARFEGMETIDRIKLVWDILDGGLTAEERRRVVTIVPATPLEEIVYTA